MSRLTFLTAGLVIYILTGCAPSKKFDFQSAYKFKYLDSGHSDQQEKSPGPTLLVSAEEKSIISGITPVRRRELKPNHSHIGIAAGNIRLKNKGKNEKITYQANELYTPGSEEHVPNEVNTRSRINKIVEITETGEEQESQAWRDTPPQFKGFVFTAVGFGVVLAGILIGSPQFLSLSLVILGFGIVGFGFLKMLGVF